jgi:hypothetical protein
MEKFINPSDFHKVMNKLMNEHENAAKRAVTPNQHIAIWGFAQAAAIPALGIAPAPINDDDVVATARTKEHDLKIYHKLEDKIEKAKLEDSNFKKGMTEISPAEAIDAIAHPQHGLLRVTPAAMYAALNEQFGTLEATTLETLEADIPIVCGTTVTCAKKVINQLRHLFTTATTGGQPCPQMIKVRMLLRIISPNPEFGIYVILYNNAYKTMETRLFETLATDMLAAAEIISLTKPSSTANAAIVEPTLTELVANAVTTAFAAHKTAPKTLNRKRGNPRKQPHLMPYCWSHGPNTSHDSSQCTSAHSKHIATATFANKQGGKATVWERGQPTGP